MYYLCPKFKIKQMKLSKIGLLPRIIIAIILGVVCGMFFSEWAVRLFVTFNSVSSIVYIIIDGEEVFRGPSCTLADILRKDKEYMEYISSHDVDGRPYDWKASE